MAAILEPDVIVTSYDGISLWCGSQRKQHLWMYYLPSKFRCYSFNIRGVKRWGPNQPPPPRSQKTKKSPVWIGLKFGRRNFCPPALKEPWLAVRVSKVFCICRPAFFASIISFKCWDRSSPKNSVEGLISSLHNLAIVYGGLSSGFISSLVVSCWA